MRNARLLLAALLAGAALTGTSAAHAELDPKCADDKVEGDINVLNLVGVDNPQSDNDIVGACVGKYFVGSRIQITDTGGLVPCACVSIFIDEEEIGC